MIMYRKQPDQDASCILFSGKSADCLRQICRFFGEKSRLAVDRILWRGGSVYLLSGEDQEDEL
ncbi:MAG TPA: hypothetical protein IAA12_10495 [Candidatus Blautia intestinipullorum]|nr:hypothetical protein [Candidatus Blautia intestinipullorum]